MPRQYKQIHFVLGQILHIKDATIYNVILDPPLDDCNKNRIKLGQGYFWDKGGGGGG